MPRQIQIPFLRMRVLQIRPVARPARKLMIAPAAPLQQSLSLQMQKQQQTNWCWAAVSTSVSLFLNQQSNWTQCKVANSALQCKTCCGVGAGGKDCNKPWYLDKALNVVEVACRTQDAPTNFVDVQTQIDKGQPLGCRIRWNEYEGHFVALTGYTDSSPTQYLEVADPGEGTTSDVPYNQFCSAYRNAGTWTHSFFVGDDQE